MSEDIIVRHCAPTLAGIKTGNLVSCQYDTIEEMRKAVRFWNGQLREKGIRILPLRYHQQRALIYVYRPSFLADDMQNPKASAILKSCGYLPEKSGQCVIQLMQRLKDSDDFPHEIGLFLGYPPEDVCGFIENHACNYKCVGCWKVYGDEVKCRKLFAKYKQCTKIYESCLAQGADIASITIAK